jgi:serine/threonine protein kinase/tetratricopeptide (TPR) repeat protein
MFEIPGYTLLRQLGRGGMAEVHLARQESLDREVALKLLAPVLASDAASRERFIREARIAANLHHPHIVPIHDVGVGNGVPYIAMEYVPGGTAASLARERATPAVALAVVRSMAHALDYAHGRGVVHRDVKPDNILRRDDGSCLLSDFGIARAADRKTILTLDGFCAGTPQYMSPEQLRGQDVDGRADLYSLGVVLFELLTGDLPFRADDGWALGMLHISEPIPRLPADLKRLQPLLDGLMAKDRRARPANGAELALRIDALQAAMPRLDSPSASDAITRPIIPHVARSKDECSSGSHAPRVVGATKSIAVLPFADLSPGHDQEYFSDGMAEEILNALTRVPDLKVAGRTSSFYFKGRNESPGTIGATLGVAHILEGSVRKHGERVRITVQLVHSADGFQVWSQSFDGDMGETFELQERIALAVAAKLDATLRGAQELRLVPVASSSPDAYLLYLQASAIFARRDGAHAADAIALLEEALRLDARFARAHARIANLHVVAAEYGTRDARSAIADAERHARMAIDLDPGAGEPHAVLGHIHRLRRRYLDERAAFNQAIAIDPDDTDTLYWYAMSLIFTGYRSQGIHALDRVLEVDPILPIALLWRGSAYASDGRFEDAERVLRRASAFGLLPIGFGMAWVEEMRGNNSAALEHLTSGLRVFMTAFPAGSADIVAAACLGDAAARVEARAFFDAYLASRPAVVSAIVPWALIRMHEPVLALEILGAAPTTNDGLVFGLLFSSLGREARAQPAFGEFVRRTGLAELWRKHGPPDFLET